MAIYELLAHANDDFYGYDKRWALLWVPSHNGIQYTRMENSYGTIFKV